MPRTRLADPLRPRRKVIDVLPLVWYGVAAVLLVLAGLSLAVSAAAVLPQYCAACHSVPAERLSVGAHAQARCDDCHMKAGLYGLVENRLAMVSMVPAALVPQASVSLPVSDESCLECHDRVLTEQVAANGIRMSHAEVEADNWTCARCHAFRIHSPETAVSLRRYSMGDCLRCHNANPKNIDTCDVCHVAGEAEARRVADTSRVSPWRVTHGKNWEKTHGMGDLATCTACHPEDYCVRCHEIVMPHPVGFAKSHGDAVIAAGDGGRACVTCHRETSCDDCHGIDMPHPNRFLERHAGDVQEGGQAVCSRCHEQTSCDLCHESHIHPGIPVDQLEKLMQRPVTR